MTTNFLLSLRRSMLLIGVVALSLLAFSPAVSAAQCQAGGTFFGLPTWYKYLQCDANGDIMLSGAGAGAVPVLILLAVFEMLLILAGMVAVGFIIYGGLKYIVSQGDSSKISAAKTTVLNALIGLVIAVIASQVVSFIAGKFA